MEDPMTLKANQLDALREVANIGAGHAAKFVGLIGHILADLAVGGRTDYPIAAFSIDRPAVRDPGFPSDFRFSLAAQAPRNDSFSDTSTNPA